MQKVEFIVERTGTGFSAYAIDYEVYTVGETLEELNANMVDAMNLHLEEKGLVVTEEDLVVNLK
ncbi:hypothetical protein GO988_05770 [Hymenobacter sp. HMF4947]|uniref:Type II toxin-antitoxin system HicB family antitoxin n=1 Tax=Hymenobacter ginkgonis TaxID=2682976 RepID=A0A7K1TBR3_9BACT|nr:hypothetical protein [Hymenobacter ginkgonis]MVN75829.1 hypothetical protein [Hymenobacter ginkgonis]